MTSHAARVVAVVGVACPTAASDRPILIEVSVRPSVSDQPAGHLDRSMVKPSGPVSVLPSADLPHLLSLMRLTIAARCSLQSASHPRSTSAAVAPTWRSTRRPRCWRCHPTRSARRTSRPRRPCSPTSCPRRSRCRHHRSSPRPVRERPGSRPTTAPVCVSCSPPTVSAEHRCPASTMAHRAAFVMAPMCGGRRWCAQRHGASNTATPTDETGRDREQAAGEPGAVPCRPSRGRNADGTARRQGCDRDGRRPWAG